MSPASASREAPRSQLTLSALRAEREGIDLTQRRYAERRRELEALELDGPAWTTSKTFDDGRTISTAVCELGFEGVVATNHSSLYRRVSAPG